MLEHLHPLSQQEGRSFPMTSFYDKVSRTTKQSYPTLVAKLKAVFESIDDAELLKALKGKTHRGCQGYEPISLWHCYLMMYVLNIPTVASLARRLQNDPACAEACGLDSMAVPSEATFSRFISKLSKHNTLVEDIIDKAVSRLRDRLQDFGETIAVDSSEIAAYSQSRKPSDADARWAKKRNKHGQEHWWFGYKIHMVADATYELPIRVEVTPANESDSRRLIHLLLPLKQNPKFVLADAGYDSSDNYAFISKILKAEPIIKMNRRGKDPENLKLPHKNAQYIREHLDGLHLRMKAGIDRSSEEWQSHYSKRTSIERIFSRMKEFRRLASVHHRGLAKIALHAYLSTLTVLASAVSAQSASKNLRKVA